MKRSRISSLSGWTRAERKDSSIRGPRIVTGRAWLISGSVNLCECIFIAAQLKDGQVGLGGRRQPTPMLSDRKLAEIYNKSSRVTSFGTDRKTSNFNKISILWRVKSFPAAPGEDPEFRVLDWGEPTLKISNRASQARSSPRVVTA